MKIAICLLFTYSNALNQKHNFKIILPPSASPVAETVEIMRKIMRKTVDKTVEV